MLSDWSALPYLWSTWRILIVHAENLKFAYIFSASLGTELNPEHRIPYYWNSHTGDAVWLRSKKKQIFPYPFSKPPTSPRHAPLHRRAKILENHPSKKKRNAYLPAIGDLRSIHIRDVTDDDDTPHPASLMPHPVSYTHLTLQTTPYV